MQYSVKVTELDLDQITTLRKVSDTEYELEFSMTRNIVDTIYQAYQLGRWAPSNTVYSLRKEDLNARNTHIKI